MLPIDSPPVARGRDNDDRATREIRARGHVLAERIDVRRLEQNRPLAIAPLVVSVGDGAAAVIFRYGAVVLFGLSDDAERAFLDSLSEYLIEPLPRPESEEIRLAVGAGEDDLESSGRLRVRDLAPERMQVIADIVAKSLVLTHYEAGAAAVFDRIEPLAGALARQGRTAFRERELLKLLGNALVTQHRMVGRVEAIDKPEVLWEHPELERLYVRLEAEYEIRERARALERKFDLIARTSELLTGLLDSKRSYSIELYIVGLIVVEILLSIYTIIT